MSSPRSLARAFSVDAEVDPLSPRNLAEAQVALDRSLAHSDATPPVPSVIADLFDSYKLTNDQRREMAMSFWRRAFEMAAEDDLVTDDELAYLAALRDALDLPHDDAARIQRHVTSSIYLALLSDALDDGVLTDLEGTTLDVVASGLRLAPNEREALSQPQYQSALDLALQAALADGRISADELAGLNRLEAAFGRRVTGRGDIFEG